MNLPATPDNQFYKAVFLSPHLDDAIYSCGGLIHQLVQHGNTILVVTVTAGDPPPESLSPFAAELQLRWQLSSGDIPARRIEDKAACSRLGVDWLHWPVPDCIYRTNVASGESLYSTEESLFGPINANDLDLIDTISQLMRSLPTSEDLYIPLGAGNHVDHQLTRMAAERWRHPSSFIYYEEFPYSRTEGDLSTFLSSDQSWKPVVIPLQPADFTARCEAMACYKSQISTFFKDSDDIAVQVGHHLDYVGGERYWHTSR